MPKRKTKQPAPSASGVTAAAIANAAAAIVAASVAVLEFLIKHGWL